jgi:hypothetical protein
VSAIASGWKKGSTAAAVTFVVKSVGDGTDHTSAGHLAEHLAALWEVDAHEVNGSRLAVLS